MREFGDRRQGICFVTGEPVEQVWDGVSNDADDEFGWLCLHRDDDEPMGEQIYEAGNSPFDAQAFVDAEDGVGLAKMKEYCEKTTKEIAKERNAKYIGIQYQE